LTRRQSIWQNLRSKAPAGLHQRGPGSLVDRSVDASATQERRIRRIDDRVGRFDRDVARRDLHPNHAPILVAFRSQVVRDVRAPQAGMDSAFRNLMTSLVLPRLAAL
jgi:hypothetical protein